VLLFKSCERNNDNVIWKADTLLQTSRITWHFPAQLALRVIQMSTNICQEARPHNQLAF